MTVIFGPAYLDIVLEVDRPFAPSLLLDQSLPATHMQCREDGLLVFAGPTGDQLVFPLPEAALEFAATYYLAEPVLARQLGPDTPQTVVGEYPVVAFRLQLGGMGAGYAKALHGILRYPVGADAVGDMVKRELAAKQIIASSQTLPACPSDSSLVLMSSSGDKLAVGVREAMVRWRPTEEDHQLVEKASALVFCGAPNAFVAEILSWRNELPVMCAPAMRNVSDPDFPFANLAPSIDYLTLNALEWENLPDQTRCREAIPVITITDGPHGSRVLLNSGEEFVIPACPVSGDINTNRAGETFGSTFLKVLLQGDPTFHQSGRVDADLAKRAGHIAAAQAARQLSIADFSFPPDDWSLTDVGVTR